MFNLYLRIERKVNKSTQSNGPYVSDNLPCPSARLHLFSLTSRPMSNNIFNIFFFAHVAGRWKMDGGPQIAPVPRLGHHCSIWTAILGRPHDRSLDPPAHECSKVDCMFEHWFPRLVYGYGQKTFFFLVTSSWIKLKYRTYVLYLK